MKIAVLMSTYNGEKYLRRQIESILQQDCPMPVDLWVRDDGSQDGTRDLLQEYQREGKLRWYTGPNLRPARSFLDLVKHCEGYDYYAFADQDDVWKPAKLARAIARLADRQEPALYFSNARMVAEDLQDMGRDVYRSCPYRDFKTLCIAGGLLGCTMVFNGALARILQRTPVPEQLIMHDFYAAQVCGAYGGSILYDAEATMLYRQHSHNVVGVSRGKLDALKDRLQTVTHRPAVTVAQQARNVLDCCGDLPEGENRNWLRRVAGYTGNIFSAVALALSPKVHYTNWNKAVTLRLALLLRNR